MIKTTNAQARADWRRMTTRLARRSMPFLLGLGLCLLAAHEIRAAAPIKVPMTADRWQATDNAEYVKYKGLDALHLKEGFAVLKDVTFRNGTIEFDVDPQGRMGAGVGFRRRDGDTYEDFYLRPRPNCAQAWDCMQYAPYTRGVLLWDMFPQYQAPAPLREGEWNHVKLVISGRRLHVFINGATSPTLKVGRLEGDTLEGGLLLQGPGYFANLTIAPDVVEGLAAAPEKDPTAVDRRFVRDWQIAPFRELPDGEEPAAITGKSPATTWRPLAAERGGVVNISREYGLPLPRPRRAVAWLKTTIVSDKDQSKRTAIGWSREVWVFVNGRQVFKDANYYQPPAARKTPEGRVSLDNGAFVLPLKKGDNEVTVAVANNFYGWGLILRLEDLEGVRLTRK